MAFLKTNYRKSQFIIFAPQTLQIEASVCMGSSVISVSAGPGGLKLNAAVVLTATNHGTHLAYLNPTCSVDGKVYVSFFVSASIGGAASLAFPVVLIGIIGSR